MNAIRQIGIRLRSLFRRDQRQAELEQEIQSHLDLRVEELVAQGETDADARRQARLEFGRVDSAKEATRDSWGIGLVTHLFRDLRYAARSLRKSPGFSAAVIGTLALCIGVNVVVFAAWYQLTRQPLPFADSDRLFQVTNVEERGAGKSNSTWSQYLDFKQNADLFEGFAFLQETHKFKGDETGARRVKGMSVSGDLFDLLGVSPVVGRFFSTAENQPGAHQVAVLPQRVWERDYRGDPGVIGTQIRFNGESPYTIVGVAPRTMDVFNREAAYYVPFVATAARYNEQDRYLWPLDLWARLKPGVDHAAGLAQLKSLELKWLNEVANPERHGRNKDRIDQITLDRTHPFATHLTLLQGAAGFVFLVGGVNVFNLLLSRAGRRRQELSIRLNLGASRFALARLMWLESFLLVGAATIIGAFGGWSGLNLVNAQLALIAPSASPLQFSAPLILGLLLVPVLGATILGWVPLKILRSVGWLQQSGGSSRGAIGSRGIQSFGGRLIVAQIAFAFVLLIGAGLLLRSFQHVLAVDAGYDADQVVRGRVDLDGLYQGGERAGVRNRILAAMREIPGVEQVAWTQFESFNPGVDHRSHPFYLRGNEAMRDGGHIFPRQIVSLNYFETLGIPILEGRSFVSTDVGDWIVDASFSSRYFPGSSALGAELFYDPQGPDNGAPWPRIIGVCARANLEGLEARDNPSVIYAFANENASARSFTLLLRTFRNPSDIINEMRGKLRQIDPALPLSDPSTLQQALAQRISGRRGLALISGAFAVLALVLVVVGIYGLLAYEVLHRTREIGLRMALGATQRAVQFLVLGHSLRRVGVGLAIGIAGAFILGRQIESLLFDVSPLDSTTYLLVSLTFMLLAATASFWPTRRATRIDPAITLRAE